MQTRNESTPPSHFSFNNPPEDLQVFNLRHLLNIIRERWLFAAAGSLAASGLLAFLLLSQPEVYDSRALLLVDRAPDRVVDVPEIVPTGFGNDSQGTLTNTLIQTHVTEMTTGRFIRDVLEELSPAEIQSLLEPYAEPPWHHPEAWIRLVRPPDETEPGPMIQMIRAVELVKANLRVGRVDETWMIQIHFSHRDPAMAAAIPNRMADHYIAGRIARNAGSHLKATRFLRAEADELRQKVERLDDEARDFREKHNLVSLAENQNIVARQMTEVSTALTQSRLQRVTLESRLKHLTQLIAESAHPRELATFPGFAFLQEMSAEMDLLRREQEVLGARYLENHPQMRQNLKAIEALEKILKVNVAQALDDLRNQHAALVAEEQELLEELQQAEKVSLELAEHLASYDLIQRKVKLASAGYSQILNRLQETTISAKLTHTNLHIADPAAAPRRPKSPQLANVAFMVSVVGGFLFVGLPLGLNAVDARLRRAGDVDTFLQRRLLGEVPRARYQSRISSPHAAAYDPLVESLRGAYSNLAALDESQPFTGGRVLALAGCFPGEGKTFVAAHLAATFAAHGKRTLLIDCDLRGPRVAQWFRVGEGRGIETYLRNCRSDHGAVELSSVLREVRKGLFVLPAFGPGSATELLERGSFATMLQACRDQFEIILVDTPSFQVFPDVLRIVPYADQVACVCELRGTPRESLKQMIGKLEEMHRKPIAGIILNKMPTGRSSGRYYSVNGYYGGEGYRRYQNHRRRAA